MSDPRSPVWARVDGILKTTTDRALGIDAGEQDLLWIPKSQIEGINGEDVNDVDELRLQSGEEIESVKIPKWLADDKGLESEDEGW